MGLGEDYPAVEQHYLATSFTVAEGFAACAERLRAAYRLGMLSNDVDEWSAALRRRFGLDTLFEVATISGAVGARKPDAAIYRAFLTASGAAADDCVFVDDRPRNLEAARTLGFRTILFGAAAGWGGLAARDFATLPPVVEAAFGER